MTVSFVAWRLMTYDLTSMDGASSIIMSQCTQRWRSEGAPNSYVGPASPLPSLAACGGQSERLSLDRLALSASDRINCVNQLQVSGAQ